MKKETFPAWLRALLLCVVSIGLLALGNYLNQKQENQAAEAARQAAFAELFPQAERFDRVELASDSGLDACYAAYQGDALTGYVAQVTATGSQSRFEVTVGVRQDATLTGVLIGGSSFAETPGLGDKVKEPAFRDQFIGLALPATLGANVDAVSGATVTSTAVVDCVNIAFNALADRLTGERTVTASAQPAVDGGVSVVQTGSGVQVVSAAEWAEQYPDVYASYLANAQNDKTVDHVAEYPMIATLYKGMAFNTYYNSARSHVYTVEDVTSTGRPHKLANCFSCKTPDYTAMVNELGDAAYTLPFEDVLAKVNESISCYNCHANTPGKVVVTHTYLSDAMGADLAKVDGGTLSCAQCHVEYYFRPDTKATTLPYSGLSAMNPDAILAYYNGLMVEGQPFADYTNPDTGVRQIKVQHPEFETYMGAGSVHRDMFSCADCHMGDATNAQGETYVSHNWTSPLDNQALLDNSCAQCHADLRGQVTSIQTVAERRTYTIGYEMELLTTKLAAAVASGEYSDEEFDAVRAVARDAQFYWDFVFVENSEGAHNSALTAQCLDKAEELANQALKMLR